MPSPKAVVRDLLERAGSRRQHRAEVAHLEGAPWGDARAMDDLRLGLLRSTVVRASSSSPFYRQLLGGEVPEIRSWDDLATLPVTSKDDLLDAPDRAISGSRLRLRNTWRTSGSSGQPYAFGVDLHYIHRHRAQRAFVYLQAGVRRGSRIMAIVPGSGRIVRPERSYSTFEWSAVGYVRDDVVAAVRDSRPTLLYGNRSHLLETAEAVARSGSPLAIPFVCSSSETLQPSDEERLREVFGAAVLEVYGSAEASNVAYRLPGESTWTVLEPRVVVEVLGADRRPVGPDEVGELVVTTLTEPTSPLLRYATGDLARVDSGPADGRSGLRLGALEGRTVDSIVGSDGERVSFWSVAMNGFWAADHVARHIARWQLHQRADRSVRVAVELRPGGDLPTAEQLVRAHLRPTLGDVPVEVEAVDRVHDPAGGKFRAVTSDATASP